MKRHFILALLGLSLFAASCSSKNDDVTPDPDNGDVVRVSGDISQNTTWTADKIYLLDGFVYVTDGATLKIEPGTLIKGDKESKATLIITRGSKIEAEGTVDKPIVFTSNMAAGSRREGDWGGLVLLGRAPGNNGDNAVIEGGPQPTVPGQDAKYIQFGGNNPDDNSGILKYVRVEYAGVPYAVDNEINGITFGGVGRGTTVEYVQVYRSGDDAFEWFGGTVNCKYLIATGTWDDDFDTDNGFSGKIQFALAQRYPLIADQSGSNGFESDNNSTGSTATPITSAVFSNVTVVGPLSSPTTNINGFYQHGAQIRRNSSISIFNSIFTGFPYGVYIDNERGSAGANSGANLSNGNLVFANNIVSGRVDVRDTYVPKSSFDTSNEFSTTLFASTLLSAPYRFPSDISSSNVGIPDFTLASGSAAATGASFTHSKVDDDFFEKVDYRGAFGTVDWTAGWASFDPQHLPYDAPGKVK